MAFQARSGGHLFTMYLYLRADLWSAMDGDTELLKFEKRWMEDLILLYDMGAVSAYYEN